MQPVQAKAAMDAGYGDLVRAAHAEPGGADPTGIPAAVQAKMEGALAADFSDVRVQAGSPRAAAMGALAFTQGNEIHVAPGQWAPETEKGQELLGHELGHVLQQRAGRVKANAEMRGMALNDEPALESEADAMGARAARGDARARRAGGEAQRGTARARSVVQQKGGDKPAPEPVEEKTIPGPAGKVFRVVDRRALIRGGPPGFAATKDTIPRGTDVEIVRYDQAQTRAEVLEHLPAGGAGPPRLFGWTAVSNLVEKFDTASVVETGTLSEVSWGETSGLYPSGAVEYDPAMWDAALVRELLAARRAVDTVGGRGESVHLSRPRAGDAIEQRLRTYHLIENFPAVDGEIADAGVKWFYLSKNPTLARHPGVSRPHVRVKSYGPFFNNGGGDVPRGAGVYLHFFKLQGS